MEKEIINDIKPLFEKYDLAKKGSLEADKIYELLVEAGHTSIFKGSVSKAIRLYNLNDEATELSWDQLADYHRKLRNLGQFEIWKVKQNVLKFLNELTNNKDNVKNSAAPGSAGVKTVPSLKIGAGKINGNINLTMGDPTKNEQYIHANLEKKKRQHGKPFAKITISFTSHQKAAKGEQLIKKLHEAVRKVFVEDMAEFISQFDSYKLNTSIKGSNLQIFISTTDKESNALFHTLANFLDNLLKAKTNMHLDFKFVFRYDFQKFLKQSVYSFYDIFTRDNKLQLKWHSDELVNPIKGALTGFASFEQFRDTFKDGQNKQLGLIISAFLCSRNANLELEFNNFQVQQCQLQSKQMIVEWITSIQQQIFTQINNITEVNILELIELFDGKMKFQCCVNEWKAQIDMNLGNINKVFLGQWNTEIDSD